jgi:hypothetical protein
MTVKLDKLMFPSVIDNIFPEVVWKCKTPNTLLLASTFRDYFLNVGNMGVKN